MIYQLKMAIVRSKLLAYQRLRIVTNNNAVLQAGHPIIRLDCYDLTSQKNAAFSINSKDLTNEIHGVITSH